MIIRRLTLEDFQIFYGRQTLDLGPGLYVVHGENGRGKTTLLSAVYFALFGHYYDRQDNAVSPRVMLNRDARREGRSQVSVELLLDDEGTTVLIRRSFDLGNPDRGVRLYVEKDGQTLDDHSANMLLRNLLDEDVARFFLFDGEQLRDYEELLFESEDAAEEVRYSIEQILGLPALTNAVTDLDRVAEIFDRDVTKAARRETSTQQAALRAQQYEQDLDDARDDLSNLQDLRTKAEAEVEEATQVLQQYEAAQDLLQQITALEALISSQKDERARESERLQKALGDAWRDVLASAVEERRREIEGVLARQREQEHAAAAAAALRTSLNDDRCSQCGQDLAAEARTAITDRLANLEAQGVDPVDAQDLQTVALALGAITRVGRLEEAVDLSRAIGRIDYEIAAKSQELQDLRTRTAEVPEAEIRAAAHKRDSAQQQIGAVQERITAAEDRVARLVADLKKIREEIERASGSQEVAELRKRHDLAAQVRAIFEAAKGEFRDELRTEVEGDSSDIFSVLTTTPEYKGLRINPNYGLETLGPDGEPVPGRSAGQEQIVAFALIGALNRNATRRAPVIMDTPLARLDRGHRAKVLSFLGDMAQQVFLLVHSAEVSEEDLAAIRGAIAREFELHADALFRTQVRERTLA